MNDKITDENAKLRAENAFLNVHLSQREDTVAHLFRKNYMYEENLALAQALIERLQGDDDESLDKRKHCLCCYEVVADEHVVRCNGIQTHTFCDVCVDRRCQALVQNPCYALDFKIGCMSTRECEGDIIDLVRLPHGRQMLADFFVHRSMPHVVERLTRQHDDLTLGSLHMMRHDGTFRGFQCAACGYGPLWNDHCSELVSHHGQKTEEGHTLQNNCPRCHTFVHDTRLLQRWNGAVIHASSQESGADPAVDST